VADSFADLPVINDPENPFSQEKLNWWRTVLELAFLVLAVVYLLYRLAVNPATAIQAAGQARLG
jgi:hypothetical protein